MSTQSQSVAAHVAEFADDDDMLDLDMEATLLEVESQHAIASQRTTAAAAPPASRSAAVPPAIRPAAVPQAKRPAAAPLARRPAATNMSAAVGTVGNTNSINISRRSTPSSANNTQFDDQIGRASFSDDDFDEVDLDALEYEAKLIESQTDDKRLVTNSSKLHTARDINKIADSKGSRTSANNDREIMILPAISSSKNVTHKHNTSRPSLKRPSSTDDDEPPLHNAKLSKLNADSGAVSTNSSTLVPAVARPNVGTDTIIAPRAQRINSCSIADAVTTLPPFSYLCFLKKNHQTEQVIMNPCSLLFHCSITYDCVRLTRLPLMFYTRYYICFYLE